MTTCMHVTHTPVFNYDIMSGHDLVVKEELRKHEEKSNYAYTPDGDSDES